MANFVDIGTEAKEERTFTVAGSKFPISTLFQKDNITTALIFQPQPRDVIVCSYPKCDSKYVDIIVWKLLYPNCKLPLINNITNRFVLSMEMVDMQELLMRQKSPRLVKTHLPLQLISFYKRAKYIYIIRSPWELSVSYYKLLWSIGNFNESFDQFLTLFLEGNLGFDCYFNHVRSWSRRIEDENVLILCHEHVRNNPRSALFCIAAFLGEHYLKQVLQSTELEKEILKSISAEKTKSQRYFLKSLKQRSFRKPTCTEKQMSEILMKVSEKFSNTAVEHMWLNLLKKYEQLVSRGQLD
ncbi:hypothetical protein JTE90_023797 [Oedothorax gibbosus]|uniref:Sulfotransferase domain-containing protein n=1 Tax=Oedothorax gibbosus TaxID=931172 RepID=A0AAV6VJJ6_9ARAC|nr:hypothetical protein JTE90_023797 [Oedothorax gibbosus]